MLLCISHRQMLPDVPPSAASHPPLDVTSQAAQIAAELAASRTASHDTEGMRQQLAGAQRQNESAADQNAALVRAEAAGRVRHEALIESSNDERAAHAAQQSESLAVQRQMSQEVQSQMSQVEALSGRLQQAHTSLERQRVSSETEVQNARTELTRVTAAARETEVLLREAREAHGAQETAAAAERHAHVHTQSMLHAAQQATAQMNAALNAVQHTLALAAEPRARSPSPTGLGLVLHSPGAPSPGLFVTTPASPQPGGRSFSVGGGGGGGGGGAAAGQQSVAELVQSAVGGVEALRALCSRQRTSLDELEHSVQTAAEEVAALRTDGGRLRAELLRREGESEAALQRGQVETAAALDEKRRELDAAAAAAREQLERQAQAARTAMATQAAELAEARIALGGAQSGASRLEVELAAARVELAHVREQITGLQNQAAVDIGVGARLQHEVDELRRQMGQQTDGHARQLEARDEVAAQLARTMGMEREATAREAEAARRAAEAMASSLHAATELMQQQLTAEQQAPPAIEHALCMH